jgi:hypothetical protein
VLAILGIQLGFPIKVLDLRSYLYGRLGNVKGFDPADTAFAVLQTGPEGLAPDSDRGDTPHPCDHYAARLGEMV